MVVMRASHRYICMHMQVLKKIKLLGNFIGPQKGSWKIVVFTKHFQKNSPRPRIEFPRTIVIIIGICIVVYTYVYFQNRLIRQDQGFNRDHVTWEQRGFRRIV